MAQYRTSPALRVHRQLAWLKAAAAVVMTVLAFVGLTGAANAPGFSIVADAAEPVAVASLSGTGDDLTITGSVSGLFASASFVGPNRAEKQDRARVVEDVMTLAQSFADVRAKIAAARLPKMPDVIRPVEVAESPAAAPEIAVASLDPAAGADALAAIDMISNPGNAPIPVTMSDKLAYARADLPATVFDGSVTSQVGKRFSDKEVYCMATAIYFESRGESYRGQVAVGQVVMNRLAHPLYPKTICGVVYQNQSKRNACQFSFACDGIPERVTEEAAWDQANQIAKDVIAGNEYLPEVGNATHYHASYVYPDWAPRMKKVTKIGMHVFYKFKRGWRFG